MCSEVEQVELRKRMSAGRLSAVYRTQCGHRLELKEAFNCCTLLCGVQTEGVAGERKNTNTTLYRVYSKSGTTIIVDFSVVRDNKLRFRILVTMFLSIL